jgi:hypothetical protein
MVSNFKNKNAKMEPRDIENPIAEEDFRHQLAKDRKENMNKVEFLKQYLIRDPISKNAALQALKDWDKLPLYAFLYCEDVYKHPFITISIHRTKKGAENALKQQKKAMTKFRHQIASLIKETKPVWKVEEITIQD